MSTLSVVANKALFNAGGVARDRSGDEVTCTRRLCGATALHPCAHPVGTVDVGSIVAVSASIESCLNACSLVKAEIEYWTVGHNGGLVAGSCDGACRRRPGGVCRRQGKRIRAGIFHPEGTRALI